MRKSYTLKITLAAVLALASGGLSAQTWQMKQAPLMTPWSETIDPQNVLPEYPRPQKVRADWMNLNGIWDYAQIQGMGMYRANHNYDKKILVPFPIESAISGIMDGVYTNPNKVLLYRRFFTLPQSMEGKNILLHFGAVDWKSEVYVNGSLVGTHQGGFDPFSFDITNHLTPGTPQEIQVQVYDPGTAGGQPHGKQDNYPNGIWYTPASGIWQTVWLEPVSRTHIGNFSITPDVDNGVVKIKLQANGAEANTQAVVRVYENQTLVSTTNVQIGTETAIAVENAKLWSPESPFLYQLEFDLKNGNTVVDQVKSYFGMRKISLGKINGVPCIHLNNKPIFQFGVLDQGYWPDGIYTAPSDEALKFDLVKTKELGMNMTRKHIKVEPARWYYHCDQMGLLVWQDIPCMRTSGSLGDLAWLKNNFYREMKDIMASLRNYPSIVSWVIYNEGWGQDGDNSSHTLKGVEEALTVDNTRLINPASGWTNYETGDIVDRHYYPSPGIYANPLQHRAAVCGEYGGITLVEQNHIWQGSSMEYVSVANAEELTTRFIKHAEDVKALQGNGLCGAVYTQVTDVEGELNGLITYDRKVVKMNPQQVQRAKAAIDKCTERTLIPLVRTSLNKTDNQWKYSTNTYANWETEGFNDATWQSGMGGFGNNNPPESNIRTIWNTNTIYLRRNVPIGNLTAEQLANLKFLVYWDEDCEIYINGVLSAVTTGYVTNYKTVEINEAGKQAIRTNATNLIAVKCNQTGGGQFIDLGIVCDTPFAAIPANGSTTGVEKATAPQVMVATPNPTSGVFSLHNAQAGINSVELSDLHGRVVKKFGHRDSYDITDLPVGLYVVKIYCQQGSQSIKLLKR